MKNTYNILAKCDKEKSYIITDFIATKLTKTQFEKLKTLNEKLLGEYRFIAYNDTDFTWWSRVNKKLTASRLYKNCCFDIDFYGNVYEY